MCAASVRVAVEQATLRRIASRASLVRSNSASIAPNTALAQRRGRRPERRSGGPCACPPWPSPFPCCRAPRRRTARPRRGRPARRASRPRRRPSRSRTSPAASPAPATRRTPTGWRAGPRSAARACGRPGRLPMLRLEISPIGVASRKKCGEARRLVDQRAVGAHRGGRELSHRRGAGRMLGRCCAGRASPAASRRPWSPGSRGRSRGRRTCWPPPRPAR